MKLYELREIMTNGWKYITRTLVVCFAVLHQFIFFPPNSKALKKKDKKYGEGICPLEAIKQTEGGADCWSTNSSTSLHFFFGGSIFTIRNKTELSTITYLRLTNSLAGWWYVFSGQEKQVSFSSKLPGKREGRKGWKWEADIYWRVHSKSGLGVLFFSSIC